MRLRITYWLLVGCFFAACTNPAQQKQAQLQRAYNIRISQLEDSVANQQREVERLTSAAALWQKEVAAAVEQLTQKKEVAVVPPDTIRIRDTTYAMVEVTKLAPCNYDSAAQHAATCAVEQYMAALAAQQLVPQHNEAIADTVAKNLDIGYLRQTCERAKKQPSNASGAASSKGFIAGIEVVATNNDYLYLVLVVENEGNEVVTIGTPALVGADTLQPVYCNLDRELAAGDTKAVVAAYPTTNIDGYKSIVIASSVATLSIKPRIKKVGKI